MRKVLNDQCSALNPLPPAVEQKPSLSSVDTCFESIIRTHNECFLQCSQWADFVLFLAFEFHDLFGVFLLQPVVCGNYSPQARTPNSKAGDQARIHRATAEG